MNKEGTVAITYENLETNQKYYGVVVATTRLFHHDEGDAEIDPIK